MKVNEIIKGTAILVGREDVFKYANNNFSGSASTDVNAVINVMISLLNMVVRELSASFVPMITTESVSADREIKIANLSKKAVKIMNVLDYDGNEVPFAVKYDTIKISKPCSKIVYSYCPNTYAKGDEIGYEETDVPSIVLAHGVGAEYCLVEGDFDRACSLHDVYVDGVRRITKLKNTAVKGRSWV